MKKFDSTDFDEVVVRDEGTILIQGAVSSVIPAKIKYSKDTNSWILTHPFIKQHNDDDYDVSDDRCLDTYFFTPLFDSHLP